MLFHIKPCQKRLGQFKPGKFRIVKVRQDYVMLGQVRPGKDMFQIRSVEGSLGRNMRGCIS
jgi:hypothetical protein